jgi:hypothetical protein
MEDELSVRFGLRDSRRTDLAASAQIKPDFDYQDLPESVQDLSDEKNSKPQWGCAESLSARWDAKAKQNDSLP